MTAFGDGPVPGAAPATSWKEAYARLYQDGCAEFPPACLHYVETVVRQAALSPHPSFPDEPSERKGGGSATAAGTAGTEAQGTPTTPGTGESSPADSPSAGAAGSLPPAAVIAAFRNAVRHDFGPLAGEVLQEWDLLTPFDLGRAIGLLGHAERLILDDGDAPGFYALDTVPLTAGYTLRGGASTGIPA